MKFYNTFKRRNGNYVTQEWSAEEMFNYDLLTFVFILIIGCILTVLSSAVCLFVKLYDYEEDQKAPSIWGIIFSLYFIIDYWRGWLVTFILKLFENAGTMKFMLMVNIALLITHVLLLIFGDTVFYNVEGESERKYTIIIYTVITLGISYFIAAAIC